jgi:phosphatidylglycerol:prolipoprotein diacylglycerol transferase
MFPVLSFGPISLPVPEFLIIIGVWIGIVLAEKFSDRTEIKSKDVSDLIFSMLISGLLGARLSYLASDPQAFQGNLLSIFSLNTNFFEPSTGIVISLAVGYFMISKKGINLMSSLDALSPFLGTLITFIYLSNFASGTNFGTPTSLPWGINLWGNIRHPVNLYLSIGSSTAVGFGIRSQVRNQLKPGCTFALIGMFNSLSGLFFTGFQVPTDLIGYSIRMNQSLWLASAVLFFLLYFRQSNISPGVSNGSDQ